MELNCGLSPLVYAELYKFVRSDRDLLRRTNERLAELGREPDWLDLAVERYDAIWNWEEQFGDVSNTQPGERLDAELATWLIAPLRATGPSDDFSKELSSRVRQRVRGRFPSGALPEWFEVSVIGWTLGRVCGRIDRNTPVVPGDWPTDPDVAAAYRGLLEHVRDLPEHSPWPEMRGSSIVIRIAGLAEGLYPRHNLCATLNKLTNDIVFPRALAARLNVGWEDFVRIRNGCAHVRREGGGYGLAELVGRFCDSDAVRDFVQAATYFVCSSVSESLAVGGPLGRQNMLTDPLADIAWLIFA